MAQATDYTIANSTGANVRADINTVLEAIATNNSGSSAPSNTQPTQFFADTSAGILKLRNTANNGYVNLFTLAGGVDVDAASNFNEDVTFTGASANIIFDKSADDLIFNDNAKAAFGTGSDLQIFHNGSNTFLTNASTGGFLHIRSGSGINLQDDTGDENFLKCIDNGAVELYFNNVKQVETSSVGMVLGDGKSVGFGNSSDLKLYHDGSHSYIQESGTGLLKILTSGFQVRNAADNETIIYALENGAVNLYYDNSIKLQTTSIGNQVTGQLVIPDGSNNSGNNNITFGSDNDCHMYHTGSHLFLVNNTGSIDIRAKAGEKSIIADPDGAVELYYDNTKRLETLTNGAQCRGIMHVLSLDGNVNQHTESLYYVIGTNSSTTFTFSSMIGSARIVLGGYANAGQGALGFYVILAGAMFATQHYQVNELINSGMQNISVSTTKNNTSYVVTISNSSSSSSLGISGFIESTGSRVTVATS